MTHIIILTGVVYFITYVLEVYALPGWLTLYPGRVIQGEIWRLITFIFIPPTRRMFFIFFVLYFYYMVGQGLEQEWASFKFNIYYFTGMFAIILGSFITGVSATSTYLNLSLFLAFARIYPEYEILLFLVLPVKMKYLAIFNWIIIIITIIFASMSGRISAIMALANYFLFFGKDIIQDIKRKKQVYKNRHKFSKKISTKRKTIHQCTVCGITEKDDPEMGFRYCSTCDGLYEYCMEHLDNHEHIKKDK